MEENQTEQNQNVNFTPPVSPSVQTPVSDPVSNVEKPKSKFPLAIIIGIILLLLIAGSAAGFYVFKQQTSKMVVNPTPSPNPMANWKTFTLSNGFTIKYPHNLYASQEDQPLGISFTVDTKEEKLFLGTFLFNGLVIHPDGPPTTDTYVVPLKKTTLNGYPATLLDSAQYDKSIWVYTPGETQSYRIDIKITRGSKDFRQRMFDTYQKMLSTFKFTDKTSLSSPTFTPTPIPTLEPQSNWKTFTNQEFGYSIKYPDIFYAPEDSISSLTDFEIKNSKGELSNGISIQVIDNPKNLTPEEYVKSQFPVGVSNPTTSFSIGSVSGVQTEFINGGEDAEDYIVLLSNKIFHFQVAGEVARLKPIFNEMMSTFKFTGITNLKAYTNEKYTFSYPLSTFVYDYTDPYNSVVVSDDANPKDIYLTSPVGNLTFVKVSIINGIMPTTFNYTDAPTENLTIHPYTSPNGYTGIRGQTSMNGTDEMVYLKKDNYSYAKITVQNQTGAKALFENVLSTFKFTN